MNTEQLIEDMRQRGYYLDLNSRNTGMAAPHKAIAYLGIDIVKTLVNV